MNWNDWYKHYESLPSLQVRLQLVQAQITAFLDQCPPGPVRILSLCAGDGRDVLGVLQAHPRRHDVSALLIDNNAESIARGRTAAASAGLSEKITFVEADATQAKNYQGATPADLVILSGFLGHLRHEDVPRLIGHLPMFCRAGGEVIWNRHLVMHKGNEQIPAIRVFFQRAKFTEIFFETTGPDGFAVSRTRFDGQSVPLDIALTLFEFVGLDRLLAVELPAPAEQGEIQNLPEAPINDTALGILPEAETTLPAWFRRTAEKYPTRPAFGASAWQPTYAELELATNRLAHQLFAQGGQAGDRVALLLRHDAPLIASALAVLKMGGMVVVLNATEPVIRLQQILDDAAPSLIITDATHQELAERIARPAQRIIAFAIPTDGPTEPLEITADPCAAAWLIYTSGSTGTPKGVIQTHRNIAHNVLRLSLGMAIEPADRLILLGSPSGGQGVSTTWCALLNGAQLCPFPAVERGVTGLEAWLNEHQITVWVSSASIFRHFVKSLSEAAKISSVRLVRFGSESSSEADFVAFQKHFTRDCVLLNTLSSSETGNLAQVRLLHESRVAPGRLPVGRPVAGIEIQLLDEQGRPVQSGSVGEIVVRSRYLSPGYWRNPTLTQERFFGDVATEVRAFRSGDLGRWDADGQLHFMDRKDTRVKIRGYRIEVSEIENRLLLLPEIASALVIVRPAPDGEPQLVAYLVLHDGKNISADALRRWLRTGLPIYMVPANFVFLSRFPLTPHGKIDRQALPPPERERKRFARFQAKPRDSFEVILTRIWEAVLGRSPIDRRDNFFDLGGTSLHSVEVLLHIEEQFNVSLPPAILLEHSTIEELAALLASRSLGQTTDPLTLLRAAPAGRPLFFIHNGKGDVTSYGLLSRQLPGRPIYGLQSVGLHGESWPLMTVPAMAERYLQSVLKADPTGPYFLASTCMGGFVAFEMAQQLIRQGRSVAMVMLLDTSPPFADHYRRWLRLAANIPRDALRVLRGRFIYHFGLKRSLRWLPAYRHFIYAMNARASHRYQFQAYPGKLTLVLTAEFPKKDQRLRMQQYAQATEIISIACSRSELFRPPAVDELARQIQNCLARAESASAAEKAK